MKTIQILVVEDERIVADDIKMILQRLGYVVSGEIAWLWRAPNGLRRHEHERFRKN